MDSSVTVIIPTLNAESYIHKQLAAIQNQSYSGPVDVVVIDSSSQDKTEEIVKTFAFAAFVKIKRSEFTHGYSRNLGVRHAKGDIVAFLSQDALPYDESWLENLIRPLIQDGIAASYSRQVPYPDASPMETYFLKTHFPSERKVMFSNKSSGALKLMDVFFSNVSSAGLTGIVRQYPFQEDLIMSEDQQFSRDVVNAGHKISYEPSSIVLHSHQYKLKTVFQRYFDSAYSLTCIFKQSLGDSYKIWRNYYLGEFREMLTKHPLWLPYYFLYFMARVTGAVSGSFASKMPVAMARRLSLHKGFWDRIANHTQP